MASGVPKRTMRIVLVAYVLVLGAYGLLSLRMQYADELHEAHHRTAQMALLLEEHVLRTVEATNLVVRRAVERMAEEGFPDATGQAEHDALRGLIEGLPAIGALALIDRDGVLRVTSQGYPFEPLPLHERGFFQAHRDGVAGLHVGGAIRTVAGDLTMFTISRPILRHGAFDGVVAAGVDVGYFRSIYERVQPGPNGALAILRTDGTLLLRHPFAPGLLAPEGEQRVRNWLVFREFLPAGTEAGVYETGSTTDGVQRVIAFRKVAGLPLVVMAMEAKGDIVTRMMPGILRSVAMGGVVLFLVAGLTLWAFAVLRRADAAGAALAEANQRLESALRQAEQSSTAKSVFLANMSHELRTPLNAIIGFTEMLRGGYVGPLNERQDGYLQDVHQAGTHLLHIMSGVLDLSKVAAGRMDLLCEPTEFRRIAEAAAAMLKSAAQSRDVTLAIEVPPQLPLIDVDPLRLKQVMINLISNAVKFTGPGGHVEVTAELDEGGFVITVRDDGIGMDAQDVESACEMFGTLASSPIKSQEGAGIGLPLSKALVELHDGTLCVDTARGGGTTVTIMLPPERVLAAPRQDGADYAASA